MHESSDDARSLAAHDGTMLLTRLLEQGGESPGFVTAGESMGDCMRAVDAKAVAAAVYHTEREADILPAKHGRGDVAVDVESAAESAEIVQNQQASVNRADLTAGSGHDGHRLATLLRENMGAVLLGVLLLVEPILVLVGFWSTSASLINSAVSLIKSAPVGLGFVAYTLLYTLLVVAAVPSSPLSFAAGFLFGATRGVIVSIIGSALAAAIALLLTRYCGAFELIRTWVERSFSSARVRSFDQSLTRDAFRFVFFVRLSPAFPYGLSNYLFAITSVPLWPYLVSSILGILPGTLILAASGSLADSLVLGRSRNGSSVGDPDSLRSANGLLTVIGILASVAVFTLITQATARTLSEDLEDVEDSED